MPFKKGHIAWNVGLKKKDGYNIGRPKGIPNHMKGKTLEEYYGIEKATKMREKMSIMKSSPEQIAISLKNFVFAHALPPHNKGKTKNDYIPLMTVSHKLYGRPKSIEHRKKLSMSKKGIHKGKTYEEIYGIEKANALKKIRQIHFKKYNEKNRERYLGENNPAKRPSVRTKISENVKKSWQVPEIRDKHIKNTLKALFKRPTKLEAKFISLFNEKNIPFTYCGNGKLIIDGRCPDFYESNGQKLCLEVANEVSKKIFNHVTPSQYEQQRINHFGKYGWKCLVLWESHLEDKANLLTCIDDFLNEKE